MSKYIFATSDFAKSIQTDINPYVTRDRINDASFRQKLDPISKNILRRQNPLELVFEDISLLLMQRIQLLLLAQRNRLEQKTDRQ